MVWRWGWGWGVGLAGMNTQPTCVVLGVIILRLQRNGYSNPIPFGPYLAIAGWIALLWGEQITSRYLQFAGFA